MLKNSNFRSPFTSKRVPFGSPFCQKLGPLWVPFLQFLGPLEIWEQCSYVITIVLNGMVTEALLIIPVVTTMVSGAVVADVAEEV